jgi:hypothetical protein
VRAGVPDMGVPDMGVPDIGVPDIGSNVEILQRLNRIGVRG